ncbi:MAG: bifunctional 5,10-methylenetetrahydrofolate dehydrogenase/5,10-methenyltetrahydrofolate cyclohydrolase [Parcubacteria group bacterium]
MEKIDGRKIAEEIYVRIGDKSGKRLKLVVVMAGNDPATESFVAQKQKTALRVGVDFEIVKLPSDAKTEEVRAAVKKASEDPQITAIVVQLPLPPQIDKTQVLRAINPRKDVDSLNDGDFLPPSAGTVLEIMSHLGKEVNLLNCAIVGYGELVGKPVYKFLSEQAKSVRIVEKGDNLEEEIKEAEVIVTGTGHAGLITPEMVRDEAIVIDFGYGLTKNGKLAGDFNPQNSQKNVFYTPTPGGTGPILVAKLFENITRV